MHAGADKKAEHAVCSLSSFFFVRISEVLSNFMLPDYAPKLSSMLVL